MNGFRVTQENVLAVHAVLLAEVGRLRDVIEANKDRFFQRCGDDPVSFDAAAVFNQKLAATMTTYLDHLKQLIDQTRQLESAAKGYGFTEHDVTAAVHTSGN